MSNFLLNPYSFANVMGIVQSVQQVVITIGTGATSNTATINSVTTTNCMILFPTYTTTNQNGSDAVLGSSIDNSRIVLTNSTTVTATRGVSSATYSVTVYATIIEFIPGIITNQRTGTINITTSNTNTATITSVDTSRSVCLNLGWTVSGARTDSRHNLVFTTLTNATTVTAGFGASASDAQTTVVSYMVVEFSASYIESIQQVSLAFNNGTSNSITLGTPVVTDNSMVLYRGVAGGTALDSPTQNKILPRLSLTSSTNINITTLDSLASSTTITVYCTVLEFAPNIVKSIQRGMTALFNSSTADTTITSVDTSKSVANYNGVTVQTAGNYLPYQAYTAIKLQSSTAIRTLVATTSMNTETSSWEVVEFN